MSKLYSLISIFLILFNQILNSENLNDITSGKFIYDVDIVVISLSKHYSGGNCIGGALLCKNDNYYDQSYTIINNCPFI